MNIHVVQPLNNFVKLPDDKWESGWWNIDESKAQKLLGGEIYFHKNRTEPSFFGGSIIDYRVDTSAQHQNKIIFIFQYLASCRNVKTDRQGWSKNMKCM